MQKENLILKYNNFSWIFILIYSSILIFILNYFYWSYDYISTFLDFWNSYDYIYQKISDNTKYILGTLIIYLVFLWYIKEKKGVIFGSIYESTTNSKYSHLLLLLVRSINFVLPVYLYYLWDRDYWAQFWLIIMIQFIILPITSFFLNQYTKIREDYNSLIEANKTENDKTKYFMTKFFLWIYNQYFIWVVFTLIFLVVFLWIHFSFNLITIWYLHISLVYIYLALNLLSNKFPKEVTIKFNNKPKKWMLLEYTKDRIILGTENENYILNPDKIEYIKVKKLKG